MRSEDSPVFVQGSVNLMIHDNESECGLEQEHPRFAETGITQFYLDSTLLTCLRSVRKIYRP